MKVEIKDNHIIISDFGRFSLEDTLDCGQAFRFHPSGDAFEGIIMGKRIRLQKIDDKIIFYHMSANDFENIFKRYFDLERDYENITKTLSKDETLKIACDFAGGIRILRQDIWETVCSFIISQNNNIPRIKGIIDRLCTHFGEKIEGGYAFPSAQKIASLTIDDLSVIRAGFRAKYIIDGAQKMISGEVRIEMIEGFPLDEAREELKKIKGVGDKVANCILLFAFGRMDALPVDVWINRALNHFYDDGKFPDYVIPYGGIAQQYLFHYARTYRKEIFIKE